MSFAPAVASGRRAGFLGKIPSQPDFVRQSLADAVVNDFDAWLVKSAQNVALVKAELPEACVRFLFSAPGRDGVVIGALRRSRDQVGRSFPLAIYTVVASPLLATRFQAVPLAYAEHLERCEAILERADTLTLDALREAVAELAMQPLDADFALQQASTRTSAVLASSRGADLAARSFGVETAAKFSYGMFTFRTATDALRRDVPASNALPTVLDCPIAIDVDLLAWLDLARRSLPRDAGVPSFVWLEEPQQRLLLTLGFASDQLLHFLADPKHRSARLWPLATQSIEAIARAQAELGPSLASAEAQARSIDELWTNLARGAR